MSASGNANLQNSATELLASQSSQPAGPSVLPPFSGNLSVDEGLKLSNENFKQWIANPFKTNKTFLNQEQRNPVFPTPKLLTHPASKANLASKYGYYIKGVVVPLSQLTATPPFPTPHVLAQFAYKAYEDYKVGETDAQYETRLELPDGWKLLTTASNDSKTNGYFGAAYWHHEHQQVVLAHRGTADFGAFGADVKGVLFNYYVSQMDSASTFAHKVVEVLQEVSRLKGVSFQLFFTGHSLGGWLAQVTTFTTEYLKGEGNIFLRSNNDNDCYHPHTVVFDSPGCKGMLSQMRNTFDVRVDEHSIHIEHLDITSYLSAPNRINTCNEHVGTVYRIFTDLSEMGWSEKHTILYNIATHRMKKIVEAFDPKTGQVFRDEEGQLKVKVVIDWPNSAGLKGGEELKNFFKYAKHLNDYHLEDTDVPFQIEGYYPMRYQTKPYDEGIVRLNVFCQQERQFLESYRWLRQLPEFFKLKELFSVMEDNQAQEQAVNILKSFEIEKNKIRCTKSSEMQALIPYVKRLLQLFPKIKENTNRALSSYEIRKRVYQIETRRYIERVSKSPLEFNSDSSKFIEFLQSFREFLESVQQKVLQLQMVGVDEWTGLIKVYQVLQNNGCLSEGQYTVLKLKHLLKLHQMMDLSALMQSTVTPHLLLMASENNQELDEETKDIIRTLSDTIKQKPNIKIVFITRLGSSTVAFLDHMGRIISGKGFARKVEELTWSDLTTSSQEKLLKESVKFQGDKIPLNKLMSVESPATNFLPLCALLEEKELKIDDPVPISNAYYEGYYIGRTLRHQVAIKRDIFNDQDVICSHVYLPKHEQEYKQICHLNPESNVHWLQEDKSGKLLWQQTQGSLETLRRYIDTENSHTYTADDLDKLLEQAKRQRVILISDTAGMGKSTVLTHLSKQIKQKFPAKWVVRVDLNDHADALNALKKKQIDKEKAIEFVSKKVLKLKSGLEMELFKQCCEQKQKVRIIIMLDGFDEISPGYKETVFDLLQALRQTAVEQLWVTTRPHLREELEHKLQQLSYTLEPFSKGNQVEFLTKFWSLKDSFTETKDIGKEIEKNKLELYAGYLVNKLAESISDKDRQLTGIPLQTRMLAEAFDEEVKIFYEPTESMPELPSKLDLLGLYERFIERKYDIYQEEKLKASVNTEAAKEQRERDLKSIREENHLLALKVLFTEEQVALFENKRKCSFSTEELTRIGIVQVSHDGKPHFIHRTFAEYYVADCLVKLLTEENNTSEQIQNFILKDIFQERQYQVIRAFIDGLLSGSEISKEMLTQYGKGIHDLGNSSVLMLHRALEEENGNIVAMLLDSLQASEHKDTLRQLLLAQDNVGKSAYFMAIERGNLHVLKKLWECANEILTAEELSNKLLLATDNEGMTAWHRAAYMGKLDIMLQVWEWAEEKLTEEDIDSKLILATDKEGMTALHKAACDGNLGILLKVWEWAEEKLTIEKIKTKLLLATDNQGMTALHEAACEGKLDVLLKIWEWAEVKLTKEDINNKLLLATDNAGMTAWHRAAYNGELDILLQVWKWAEDKLTTEEVINKLLLATDNEGMTAWQGAARWGTLEILQKIWEFAKEKLTTEEINNKLLLATDNAGNTAWQRAAYMGKLDILLQVWEWAEEKLTKEEINNKLLLATDNEGMTAWQGAAKSRTPEVLQKIWEWAKEKLTKEEIKDKLVLAIDKEGITFLKDTAMWGTAEILQTIREWAKEKLTTEEISNKILLATDNGGMTAWHWAAYMGRLDILLNLWEWAEETLTTEDIICKLLLATDNAGMSACHWAAVRGRLEVLMKILEWGEKELKKEEINNKLLLATDNEGWTAWHYAAHEGNLDVLLNVWKWAEGKLTREEINSKFLLATDNEGMTAWHWAAYQGELEIMLQLWEWAEEKLTIEEINNKLLLVPDNAGMTALHQAAYKGNLDILLKIWEWAEEIQKQTKEINKKLLLATDNGGWTAWHWAAHEGNLDVLLKVWEWAEKKLTTEEINSKLLLATDNDGMTAWHWAAHEGSLDILLQVWEWAEEKLTAEDINIKLILAKDNEGITALHEAAKEGNLNILLTVWEWAQEKLTREEINNKMLLATDNQGMTAWHWAACEGNLDVLQKLWNWAEEKLTKQEINNKLLLATDNEGWTAWHRAAYVGNQDILQKLWNWAEEKLTREDRNNILFLVTDNEGRTIWHVAAKEGKLEIFLKLWFWAVEKLRKRRKIINN